MSRHVILIALFALLAACSRLQPIQNIEHQAVATGSGNAPTVSEVRTAIIQAAAEKTWNVRDIDANHLEATVHVRSHTATVVIEYAPTSYSITYKDSDNLLKEDDRIHRRYNSWVNGLRITIDRKLAEL